MQYIIGVDIGGTGTDCVVMDEKGELIVSKAFSTPPEFTRGVLDALQVAAEKLNTDLSSLLSNTRLFLHSTTVAENAIVDGTLAKGGMLATRGFEETLFMTRCGYGRWSGRTDDEIKNPIELDKPAPLIPISMIKGVKERTDYKGEVLVRSDESEIAAAVQELVKNGAEAIGVCFLWSFQNADNENKAKKVIQKLYPNIFLTTSNELAPIMGEYERTSTVALNIILGPSVFAYLTKLKGILEEQGFQGVMLIMQAYGGLLKYDDASKAPVGLIESGPAGGLVGSKLLGEILGYDNIIAADMGGTTFKAGIVRGRMVEYQLDPMVLRYHYSLPKMDVVSIGLAGGSIVHLDPRTGVPLLGPMSAGAYPGAVCYSFGGTEPTITDIDLILGYLNQKFFLEGRARLDSEAALHVFKSKIADPLGMDVIKAASEVYNLANSLLYDLLHKMTVEKGLDPRDYILFSYGGTAGMHLGAIGQELGVKGILIPYTASVHGAYGLIGADVVHEVQISHPMRVPVDIDKVNDILASFTDKTTNQLKSEGFKAEDILIQRSIDMRYRRQIHVITTPIECQGMLTEDDLERIYKKYEQLYEERYGKGSAYREAGMEIANFRVRAIGLLRKPDLRKQTTGKRDSAAAVVASRKAYFSTIKEVRDARGYDFNKLVPGNEISGPAIIWTPITTIVVNPGQQAAVDQYKNVLLTW